MAQLDFQLPLDQPTDRNRLLERLRTQFDSGDFSRLRLVVAFARIGPLRNLIHQINSWAESGYEINAIFGIDLQSTSAEALAFALEHFDGVSIVHQRDDSVTFHPKIYLFEGDNRAYAYVGSNNLTNGGTQSNFEAGVGILMDLTDNDDLATYEILHEGWAETKSVSLNLTKDRLHNLMEQDKVLSEKEMWVPSTQSSNASGGAGEGPEVDRLGFPQTDVEPTTSAPVEGSSALPLTTGGSSVSDDLATAGSTLIMEVRPRNNGEVHLSRTAAKQNTSFFRYPFEGSTEPKKETNDPYPERDPKPIVNVRLYDEDGKLAVHVSRFEMKMADYLGRGEIRIMMPSEVKNYEVNLEKFDGPEYCILVMQRKPSLMPHEYDLSIYIPGSSKHHKYRQLCNKTMPAGGKDYPRHYGWLE
jgi:HKD family nuclease